MAMETLSEAITRLEHAGYTESVAAHDDGKLHCSGCRSTCEPDHVTIDDVVRFEGDSNPDDEAVLFALDCGQHKACTQLRSGPKHHRTTSLRFEHSADGRVTAEDVDTGRVIVAVPTTPGRCA